MGVDLGVSVSGRILYATIKVVPNFLYFVDRAS
jgi:hypothetical protein